MHALTEAAPPAATLPASIVECKDLQSLPAIFAPEVQIAILPRPACPRIEAFLDEAIAHGALTLGFRCALDAGQPLPLSRLPEGPGAGALAEDIGLLAELFSDLLGCTQVGVRLEVLQRAMCPRFHVDRVGIRLLCTYRGRGTEYLDDAFADRDRLGRKANGLDDHASGLIRDPAAITTVPPHAIALLKGSAWQDNAARGAIHRSPAGGQWPRVVLAIDAIW